jgi:hypothetical protein
MTVNAMDKGQDFGAMIRESQGKSWFIVLSL